jgi:hypothetical protein
LGETLTVWPATIRSPSTGTRVPARARRHVPVWPFPSDDHLGPVEEGGEEPPALALVLHHDGLELPGQRLGEIAVVASR